MVRRVSFKAEDGTRAVVDGVIKHADGSYTLIETKLRKSTSLTTAQKKVYDELKKGTAKPVGENAKDAQLKVGEAFKATVQRVNKINE